MKYLGYVATAAFFLLFLAMSPVSAQEEEAVEEAVEEVVEEVVEEAEAVEEAVVEEEVAEVEAEEAVSPLAGFTAGLNFGYPVVTGEYYKDNTGPYIGLVVGTPYGFPLGPFNIGVGVGLEAAMMGDYDTEIGFFGVVNTSIYVTPSGPISLYGGAGFYGGIGLIGGASFDYAVPNLPLVIKPYLRATILSGVTEAGDPSGWISVGAMVSYDISTLF